MSEILPPGAVTTADLYRELRQISELMVRLEERVQVLPDHEKRLRLLEGFRYTLLGISAVVGALSGILTAVLASLIAHRLPVAQGRV